MCLVCVAAQADLTARLSSPQIDETQTLELTIRTDSRDVQGMPDLAPITKDFEVLTTRTSSQYRVSNGNVQAWTDWIIALRPLRVGTLNIPPLSYRGEETQPLQLRVVPLDPAIKQQMGDRVFFETTTEPERPFVQAQVVFVRRLLYADGTQIYGEMPDTPVIEEAVVIPLGNATSSTVTRNNRRYGMIEQRYAIFPERSGTLEIPGAVVSGSVRMNVNGRLRRNGVRVIADPMELQVRPIPEDYPADTPWLPATRVDLIEAWDQSPPVFALGEPLTQTLIVRSDAATGSIIPPLDYSIPDSHFRSYPEQPDIADNQRLGGIIGTRSQTWSLIPTAGGRVTLPEVELTWFDTDREEVRVSTLSARTLSISGAPPPEPPPPETAEAAPAAPAEPDQPVTAADRRVFSWVSTAALLVVLLGIAWYFRELLQIPALTPGFVVRRRYKDALREAIKSGSISDIREQLEQTMDVYESAGKKLDSGVHKRMLALLSSAAYAPTPTDPDRTTLSTLLTPLLSPESNASRAAKLPPLYPRAQE